MNRSIRSMALALMVVSLVAAPAIGAVTHVGTDPNDTPSLLDIERSRYALGDRKITFTVNTYDEWPNEVLEEGRIRILINSMGPATGMVDAADYVVWRKNFQAPTGATAALGTGGTLEARMWEFTDDGLKPLGRVEMAKTAGDHVLFRFLKDRIERRASGRMLWRVDTYVDEGAPGGSEPGQDRIPNSGMLDSGA